MPEVNSPVRSWALDDSSSPSARCRTRPRQRQDLHAGVIVIKDLALRCLADQFVESGPDHFGHFLDDLPLGRGRQGNPQTRLQSFQPVKRHPATVLQQRDHRRRRLVVLLLAHALRRCRFKNLAAQIAAETFQFIDRGRNRRLAHHPDAQSGFLLFVNLTLLALRTAVSRLQGSVRDLDPASPAIRLGAVSAVPRLRRILGAFGGGLFFGGALIPACSSTLLVFSVLGFANSARRRLIVVFFSPIISVRRRNAWIAPSSL